MIEKGRERPFRPQSQVYENVQLRESVLATRKATERGKCGYVQFLCNYNSTVICIQIRQSRWILEYCTFTRQATNCFTLLIGAWISWLLRSKEQNVLDNCLCTAMDLFSWTPVWKKVLVYLTTIVTGSMTLYYKSSWIKNHLFLKFWQDASKSTFSSFDENPICVLLGGGRRIHWFTVQKTFVPNEASLM